MAEDRRLEATRSRRPLVLLGVLALVGVVALGVGAFKKSVTYYVTPTELMAQTSANTGAGHPVRVSGTVVAKSISFDAGHGIVKFRITDTKTTLPVLYTGTAPDTLKDGAEAVAEGSLDSRGVFQAGKIFAKCPSKFEKKKTASTAAKG